MREIDAGIDWDHEGKADLWPLERACKLLYPRDPYSWPEISHLTHSCPAWMKLYNLAVAAINAETLWHRKIRGKPWVRPREFLAWARDKGFTIPPELAGIASPRPPGWPWGSYETKLLRDLAAAVEHFWKNYDPKAPPINPEVATWLVEHHGVGPDVAASMATILRADGLPKGRPKRPK